MRFLGRTKLKYIVFGLGVISLVTLFYGYKALAAPAALSLTTSPVVLNLNIAPGGTTSQSVELMNNTDAPIPINMKLMSFGAYGSTGEAAITDIPASDPESKYVSLVPSSFVAQPKVWSKVKVTISLPATASLGYYYAIVFQPVYSGLTVAPGKNIVKGSNAILVLLNTNSANEKKSIQIASFKVSRGVYEYLPADFSVNLRNSGNIYLAPHGDIFISRGGGRGQSIAVLPINGGGGNVLPSSNRIFTASWADGFPVYTPVTKNGNPVFNKHNQPENNLKWNFDQVGKFRFGRYYANLVMTYNDGPRTVLLNAQLTFWVIPWLIMLVILVIVLIILLNVFIIGRSIYRKLRRSKSKKQ